MNENAYFVFTYVSMTATIFYFKHFSAIFLVENGAFWNCHTKEATSEMFVVMQYHNKLGLELCPNSCFVTDPFPW